MKPKNVQSLTVFLNQNIKDGLGSHDIKNSTYSSSYMDIFFDEIKEGNPLPYDQFCQQLRLKEEGSKEAKEVLERFMRTWNAWTDLYRRLNDDGKIQN